MTVIFVITKNKYFNVIEETVQTMCMDFINDNVWCIIDCLYQIVPDMFLYISMIDSGNKYTTCYSSVVMMNFKIVYVREVLKIFRYTIIPPLVRCREHFITPHIIPSSGLYCKDYHVICLPPQLDDVVHPGCTPMTYLPACYVLTTLCQLDCGWFSRHAGDNNSL